MPAPKGVTYTPKSGPLAGRTFVGTAGTTQAYNRYQQARARVLGFSGYAEQRRVMNTPQTRALFTSLKERPLQGPQLPTKVEQRTFLQRQVGEFFGSGRGTFLYRGTGGTIDVDVNDHTIGGSFDRYLIAIGRRTGTETWLPGETPH